MNSDIVKGNWTKIKGKLRQQWGNLTDDNIAQMQGSYEELQGSLQKAYGYEKEDAKKQIDKFLETNGYRDTTEIK